MQGCRPHEHRQCTALFWGERGIDAFVMSGLSSVLPRQGTPPRNVHTHRVLLLLRVSPVRCPALFLAKDAALSTFSVAKQTSIVVDSGYSCTTGESTACDVLWCAVVLVSYMCCAETVRLGDTRAAHCPGCMRSGQYLCHLSQLVKEQ